MPLDPEKIRTRREKLGLTQATCADLAGMHRPNWARIESGREINPYLDRAEKIAKALGCSLKSILS